MSMQKLLTLVIRKLSLPNLGKKKWQVYFQGLHKLSLAGMNYGKGSEVGKSGEEWVIDYLQKQLPFNCVIFDGGANSGEYSLMLSNAFPKADIHSFEPSRHNFNMLEQTVSGRNINIYHTALGKINGRVKLYSHTDHTGMSGFYNRNLSHLGIRMETSEETEVISIDEFCQSHGIEKINFLKLDTEGSELSILEGAIGMMDKNDIDYIQFEFGGCNIDSGTWFRDFFIILTPKFRIYRILQDGLQPIFKYSEQLEIFLTTNFLAIRKDLN